MCFLPERVFSAQQSAGDAGEALGLVRSPPHSPAGLFSVSRQYDLTCLYVFSSSRPLTFLSRLLIPITFPRAVSPAGWMVNVAPRDGAVRRGEQEGLRQRSRLSWCQLSHWGDLPARG